MGNLYIAYLVSGDVYRIRTTVGPGIAASWNVNSSGNWSLGTNWTAGAAPNGVGHAATFGPIITANRTVTVDAPQTVGAMTFDNAAASYTIAGANTITLDATSGDARINVTSGSHTISAPVSLADNTVITVSPAAGNLSITATLTRKRHESDQGRRGHVDVEQSSQPLDCRSTPARWPWRQAARPRARPCWSTLSIAGGATPTAKLDLTNNAAIINYTGTSPAATVRQQILAGRGGPGLGATWNGPGITSSAAADGQCRRTPNRARSAMPRTPRCRLVPTRPFAASRWMTLRCSDRLHAHRRRQPRRPGQRRRRDDRRRDLRAGVPQPSWALGDFDYNGFVDDDDVTLLGAFYDPSVPPLAVATTTDTAAAVPEPGAFVLATLAALALASAASRRRS